MSSALNLEMREVEKALGAANAAVTREEWAEAERALAEVQDRVGRLLREVGLKQASVPIVEPPSPIKGDQVAAKIRSELLFSPPMHSSTLCDAA